MSLQQKTINIRTATPIDANAIANIHVAAWRAAYINIVPQHHLDDLNIDDRVKFWQRILSTPATASSILVAGDSNTKESRLLGFVSFGAVAATPSPGDKGNDEEGKEGQERTAELRAIYISPQHWTKVKEAGRTPPPFPLIFSKPNTCIWDHGADVVIPKIAQDGQADYEGELCIVVGKDAKDVSKEDALDYVGAYTAGNDISSRKLQRNPNLAGRVPQWGFSKGFDTFAPMGPCLVAGDSVEDPSKLQLQTIIDGEVRQEELVNDLLFDCAYLVHYLSQGTVLQKGSIIMTGTPGGVGAGLRPPKYLVPGTQMEVIVYKIGTLSNEVKFA
ncbi:hypothetical protein KCU73_g3349, partial [Aureobasidium melanogenum]